MALGTRLMALGLGMSEIQNVARELFRFGRDKIGADQMGEIISGTPGLSQFAKRTLSTFGLSTFISSSIMTYPLSEIEGLTAYSASKLKSQGIRTTEALLEAARTVKGRKALAAKTGISEQQLLEWANFSDYMRIPGMGKAKVGLVRAAGVTTVRELALRNPARLAQNMKDVNTRRKLVRVLPSERSVEQLIEQARKLQPKISY